MLEIKFKTDASPVFCKPRFVPFAIQDDLVQAFEAGITKGVWKSTQFNSYGTPVVPIRKKLVFRFGPNRYRTVRGSTRFDVRFEYLSNLSNISLKIHCFVYQHREFIMMIGFGVLVYFMYKYM